MRKLLLLLALSSAALLAACAGDDKPDASTAADAATHPDAAPAADAAAADAAAADAAAADAAAPDAEIGDTGTSTSGDPFRRLSCAGVTGTCVEVRAEDTAGLFDTLNSLVDGTTVVLGAGIFDLNNAVTIRNNRGITLTGQGIDVTVLSFLDQPAQSNGVDVVGDDFTIDHLTISDSKKDGLRIEDSTNVKIQFVKVTWSGGPLTTNGSYGIYPVRCTNVLMEDSEAYNASDAGLYVGQSINVIVRRNIARRNVAGLEIENTQFADVYQNLVEDNAGGLLIFDLPGNPVIGRDIRIHDNTVQDNNRLNFAPSGTTVSQIPAGTGTFALASRRVEIAHNTYARNDTTDIALLSGLAIRSSTGAWAIPTAMVRGSTVGLQLLVIGESTLNFRSYDIWVHDNSHSQSGRFPDGRDSNARPLGALLQATYIGTSDVDNVLYDGIGEMVSPTMPVENTNLNHMCVENETGGTYATLDLPRLAAIVDSGMFPTTADIYRPAPPWVPFNCTGVTGEPIAPVVLPF